MNLKSSYRLLCSCALTLLLLNVLVLKEIHHLFEHQHAEGIACEAKAGHVHYHGPEYAFVDCLICHFNFYPTDKTADFTLAFEYPHLEYTPCFPYKGIDVEYNHNLLRLRGPPSLV